MVFNALKKQETYVSDDSCKEQLSQYLGEKYEKTNLNLYKKFKSKIHIGINNAKIVHQNWKKQGVVDPNKMSPCTNVYMLVEELLSWKKK